MSNSTPPTRPRSMTIRRTRTSLRPNGAPRGPAQRQAAALGTVNAPLRGQVYRCDLGYGAKPWLIVSNNARNRHTADVVAVRLTTTRRTIPTWVAMGPSDPLTGYVNADNIETLGKDELGDYLGEVTPATMNKINTALATALGLPWP